MAWSKSKTMHNLIRTCCLDIIIYNTAFMAGWITGHLLHSYSGRKLTRFGRSVDWSFLMSLAETRQASSVNCFRFFRVFRCRSPAEVILEFEMFKETNPVKPVHIYWSRGFRTYIQEISTIFLQQQYTDIRILEIKCKWNQSLIKEERMHCVHQMLWYKRWECTTKIDKNGQT